MKPKAKTIIERQGFKDPDRNVLKHDEIQLWVFHNHKRIIKTLWPEAETRIDEMSFKVQLEYPISDRNYVIGFVDLYPQQPGITIEVKTEIPNVGELLRQINFYRNYLSGPSWVVVSPDDRFENVLKTQGVHFYKFI